MSSSVPFNPLSLDSKRIIVTGASSGIGREASRIISKLGGKVTLVARDESRLLETYESLDGDGHQIENYDLSDCEAIAPWMKAHAETYGPISGVVHCAGIQQTRPVRHTSILTYESIMDINCTASFALAKAFRQRGVFANGGGSIVYLSSVAAIKGKPGIVAYSTSKAALLGMTRSLAAEFSRDGIRVNSLIVGHVKTEMADLSNRLRTKDQIDELEREHLLGLGRPQDVAYSIAFLLADTGRWITGSSLVVDGGYSVC